MSEQDYKWLLARLLVVIRAGYITSHIAPLYDELKTVLTNASGVQIDSTTPGDDQLLDLFRPSVPMTERPRTEPPDEPVEHPKARGRK